LREVASIYRNSQQTVFSRSHMLEVCLFVDIGNDGMEIRHAERERGRHSINII